MNSEKEQTKRPYEKPLLREIELAGDEVLSTGCKNGSTPPYEGSTSQFNCFVPATCNADGS